MTPDKAVRVEAYCSTANLGAGFDTFGLALDEYADRMQVKTARTQIVRIRTLGPYRKGLPTAPDKNPAGPPARALLDRSRHDKGVEITIEKNIPPGLGLGSSGEPAASETGFRCKTCGGLLEVKFDLEGKKRPSWNRRQISVWKYRELLPVENEESIISLAEGGTGHHRCIRLGRKLGLKKFYVKNEGENPTGSFKDREMTVAISKAKSSAKKNVLCASTGNTAASLAAYSARAGMECIVLVPKGKVAGGKMLQVTMHGARIIQVKGDFDRAFETALKLAQKRTELYLMNSINPYRLEGQKTLAFEISDQLDSKHLTQ